MKELATLSKGRHEYQVWRRTQITGHGLHGLVRSCEILDSWTAADGQSTWTALQSTHTRSYTQQCCRVRSTWILVKIEI